ncbi:MAG: hypothetical protein SW833_14710 [Cyanobacteriota bacterium]|nr:hypothetical protein [Cyanobacteriota bacterium]
MAELLSPSVNLLMYDLRNESGQTLEEIQENRDLFAKKLPQNAPPLAWNKDNQYNAEFVELFGDRKQVGTLPVPHRDYQGYYYPVRMQNVYGLLLNCTVKDRSPLYSAALPGKIKSILEQVLQKQTGTLGQTWIVSACAEAITQTQTLALARECYHNLFSGKHWDDNFIASNRFLGGTLFELESYDLTIPENLEAAAWETWIAEKQVHNHHVLIAIYPNFEMLAASNYFMTDWMRIFCFRHKVLWNYTQACLLKQLLESDLSKIQKYAENPSFINQLNRRRELEGRWNTLRTVFLEYQIDLNYFKGKLNAIASDLERYNQQADSMAETLISENLQNNAAFLDTFARNFKKNNLFLLRQDEEILSDGLTLLETTSNLLQGEMEVHKIKRDRAFQNTALAVGTGLGCGIATATIVARGLESDEQQTDSILTTPVGQFLLQTFSVSPQWIVPATAGLLSLTVAIVAASAVRLFLALARQD